MNNDSQIEIDDGIINALLYEVLFLEKKNANTKDYTGAEMERMIKKSIEREMSKNDIQTDQAKQL